MIDSNRAETLQTRPTCFAELEKTQAGSTARTFFSFFFFLFLLAAINMDLEHFFSSDYNDGCPDAMFRQSLAARQHREAATGVPEKAKPGDVVGHVSDLIKDSDPNLAELTRATILEVVKEQAFRVGTRGVGCQALLLNASLMVLQQMCAVARKKPDGFFCGQWILDLMPMHSAVLQAFEPSIREVAVRVFKDKKLSLPAWEAASHEQLRALVREGFKAGYKSVHGND